LATEGYQVPPVGELNQIFTQKFEAFVLTQRA
jgi:hypothetical protein